MISYTSRHSNYGSKNDLTIELPTLYWHRMIIYLCERARDRDKSLLPTGLLSRQLQEPALCQATARNHKLLPSLSYVWQGPKLWATFCFSREHQQGAVLEVQQLWYQSTPTWVRTLQTVSYLLCYNACTDQRTDQSENFFILITITFIHHSSP